MTLVTDARAPRIAVVGATGAVGHTLIGLIEQRGLRYRDIQLVASARSAGTELSVDGVYHPVQAVEDFDFSDVDLAFFSAGTEASTQWVPKATAAGAVVIDNTIAYRMDPDTPLVVPQVNAHELDTRPKSGVIANPNCSTIPLVRLLKGVEQRWGVRQAVVSTYHGGVRPRPPRGRGAEARQPRHAGESRGGVPQQGVHTVARLQRHSEDRPVSGHGLHAGGAEDAPGVPQDPRPARTWT